MMAVSLAVLCSSSDVLGVVSIFTYGMKKGLTCLAEANVKNISLTDFDAGGRPPPRPAILSPRT